MQSYSTITSSPHFSAPPPTAVSTNPDSSQIINYQYNYNCSYGGIGDDFQHKQLHRIWETDPEGQLLINRNDLRNLNLAADQTAPIRHVYLDIYLPNGLLLPIQCPAQRTLALLKQDVFIQAKKYPLNDQLSSISNYIFATIGLDGAHVDLYDEQKTVSSIQFLFLPLLILIEPHGNKIEKELNQNIGFVMGITLRELEHSLNEELQQCRLKLFQTCLEAEAQRGTYSFCHYAFPEEPLIHSTTSATFRRKRYDEVSELDLATQQFPEQPEEIERRAMEKLRQKIQFSDAYVEIWYEKYSVCIRNVLEMTVEGVINAALRELRTLYGQEINQQPSDLILQIAGRRVFVTRRGVPLTQFNYIRSCFENYRIPRLIIRQKKLIFNDYPPPPKIFEPSYVRKERHNEYIRNESIVKNENKTNTTTAQAQRQTKLFWDLDENMKIRIHSISNVTVHDVTDRFFIRVAVAVGRHVLDLKESPTITPSNPRWTQETFIEFDVYLKDLPESAQLCFSLITLHNSSILDNSKANAGSGKNRGGAQTNSKIEQQQIQPVGWANIRVFDWRSNLIQGKQTLHFRPFEKEEIRLNSQSSTTPEPLQFIHFENYLGLIESSSTATSRYPRLEIEMPEYFGSSTIIQYPSDAIIRRYIGWLKQQKRLMRTNESQDEDADADEEEEMMESDEYGGGERKMQMKLFPGHPDLERLLQLRRCLDSAQLTEDDQCFLWRMRYKILHLFPQMLPVLADCALISRDRETTSEFYHLLSGWPQLQVDTAIELLDGRYVDGRLRAMAVQHLDTALDDDQLQLYLLILIQAIRFEPHAFSPLLRMLLARSLMDYRVGHTLFWLLRAELAHLSAINPVNSTTSPLFLRLALLLEAYCRGNCAHLESMIKQVEMISTLTTLSVQIRNCGNKEAANKKLQQELLARKDQLQNMISPVNATDRLGELIIEECKVLSSAKQPLLLTWRNPEILAELSDPIYQLIFKCGDDMRQDMLSLHVMRIMDAKWKSQLQQDYCMTLYEVLPMGKNIGLIHVVPNCQTLFQIQCETKRAATLNMDVALLNKYIYKKCCESDSKKYLECVDRFTFSLAGYCVATYILGIKDRHQDNIMLAKDGRIFHIDFGHFLGHTKRKLGINRERTNFILTDHFLYVISRGKSNVRQTYEYTSFREECIKGFLVLHNQARFFIALFRMMCCMGLPELNCPENVDFLRQSLMYEKTGKDEARLAFEQIFEEVVKGDWSVQLNWFFHSVRHM